MAIHISTLSAPTSNPLDIVEEVIISNDWSYERFSEEELGVEISGKWCNHRFVFMWKNEWESLHFTCYMDVKIPKARIKDACELIIKANQKVWLGGFELSSEDNAPGFRYTMLLRGNSLVSTEQIEDLVDIALTECERFYPALQLVVWGGKSPDEALAVSLFDTVGEA